MLNNVEAVIFDLDGTLIDSMWLWGNIDIEFLKRYNIKMPQDIKKELEGMSFTESAQYFKKRFKIKDSIEEIKKEWNKMALDYYTNKVPLKKGALEFIQYLHTRDIPMGIATSNSRELLNIIIKKYKLDYYIKCMKTSCEVNKGKPEPDVYLAVAKELGVNPSNCLVFEDVPMGIMAGKNAGMKVCAVYDENSEDVYNEKITLADYYVESLEVFIEAYNIKLDNK